MSGSQERLQTTEQFAPEQAVGVPLQTRDPVGLPVSRVDGPLKVRGEATFTAEFERAGAVFAALVYSRVARGKIARIDAAQAERSSGVLIVMTHQNAPAMKVPPGYGTPEGGAAASTLPVMQDDQVYWNGQPVAVVVAETQAQADFAASLVSVEYSARQARVAFDALKAGAEAPPNVLGEPAELKNGDAEAALKAAPITVDQSYRTQRQSAGAIELHATTASWNEDGELTVYDSTQSLSWVKNTLCAVFDLTPKKVRVVAPFVGGGFGGKAALWNHTLLCVAAAKLTERPVKLSLSREGTFRATGERALSEQRVALGAGQGGKLASLIHTGTTGVVDHTTFFEQFSFPARHLYAAPAYLIAQKIVKLDMVANTSIRAPGDAIGTFALESAMDELAHTLGMDPIELRRVNEPQQDPTSGLPFSNRHLLEA